MISGVKSVVFSGDISEKTAGDDDRTVGGRHIKYWEPIVDQWRCDLLIKENICPLSVVAVHKCARLGVFHDCVCVFSVAAAGADRDTDILHGLFPRGHLSALRGLREPSTHVRTAAGPACCPLPPSGPSVGMATNVLLTKSQQ